jgi:hypothetical protein
VAVGFMVGYGAVFLPIFVFGLVVSGMAERIGWAAAIGLMLAGPLILAANSYVLSALVMLGLWLLAKMRRN